jgi:GntR family transcriptional regulator, transcriptional repressor for pyruvate dehydrogenase complex
VLRILELRTGLEIAASGLAAERRTSDDLTQIEAALESIEAEIEAGGDAVHADYRFHLAIFRSVHNRLFPQFLEFLRDGRLDSTHASVSAQTPPIASNGLSLHRRTESRL